MIHRPSVQEFVFIGRLLVSWKNKFNSIVVEAITVCFGRLVRVPPRVYPTYRSSTKLCASRNIV